MKKTKIVVLVFALLLGILVVVGIRKQKNNVIIDDNMNKDIAETTSSCFSYIDVSDGVRVLKYNISNPDAYFVDVCKKTIMTDEIFGGFKEIYPSNDNYHSFCSNKTPLTTELEDYISTIKLEHVLEPLMNSGAIDLSDYEYSEKYYTVKDTNKCVTFLEKEGYDKEELFDYCSGNNTSIGNLYEDNRSHINSYYIDTVSKMINGKILVENNEKMAYINNYNVECGDVINIPKTIDGKKIYGLNVYLNGAKVLLLPNSIKRIDRLDGIKVKTLTIPNGVIYIESESFTESDIENVIINGNPVISGNAFNNKVKTVKYGGTCDELNNYKEGFNNYKEITFKGKRGSCSINEE